MHEHNCENLAAIPVRDRWTMSYWHINTATDTDDADEMELCSEPHPAEGLETATLYEAVAAFSFHFLVANEIFLSPMENSFCYDPKNPSGGFMAFYGVMMTPKDGPKRVAFCLAHQIKRKAESIFEVLDDSAELSCLLESMSEG